MLVNSCYVSRGIGVKKVSNSKRDAQGHTKSIGIGAIWYDTYDFLLVFYCNYVFILHC